LQGNLGFAEESCFLSKSTAILFSGVKKNNLIFYLIHLSNMTLFFCSHLSFVLWFSGNIWLGRHCWQQVSIYVPCWNRSGDGEAANWGT